MQRQCRLFVHLAWSTWNRAPLIDSAVSAWLWPVIAEKAKALGSASVVVGGVEDHVHVVTELPATISVSEFVRHLKGASSAIAGQKLGRGSFRWQGGYGAFTIRKSEVPTAEAYVRNQAANHAHGTLDAEFESMPEPFTLIIDD